MNKKYHIPRQRIMGYTSPIIQRFYEKWGEDYLQRALPNESRQRKVEVSSQNDSCINESADNSNLEEMFIGSMI